jgi:2-polyprenyl-3-methyl-5-hydroxy-6-metoxy-1,4-benzoquinol methylase
MTVARQEVRGPAPRPADRLIRTLRIRQAARYIEPGRSILDVGCFDGSLFTTLGDRVASGVGLDPLLIETRRDGRFRFVAESFPTPALGAARFDVIAMLAVLEHVPDEDLAAWVEACATLLEPDGIVVATIPDPRVDTVLHLLMRLRLVAGMAAHEHHGAAPNTIVSAFADHGFALRTRRRFEFGLNNLFVFEGPRQATG